MTSGGVAETDMIGLYKAMTGRLRQLSEPRLRQQVGTKKISDRRYIYIYISATSFLSNPDISATSLLSNPDLFVVCLLYMYM